MIKEVEKYWLTFLNAIEARKIDEIERTHVVDICV